jgi:hypothetical protein
MSTENAEKSKELLMEIQNIFTDDKGWDTEESMIEDVALFRRLQKEKDDSNLNGS